MLTTLVVGFALLQPQPRTYSTHVKVADLNLNAINESSGLAPSWTNADQYYTHNDSGDTARFFRFNASGQVLSTFALSGVTAVDWEDMASAKIGKKSYIYVGDVGDNNKNRAAIRVYKIEESTLTSGGTITGFQTYQLTYPDGARNCETVMVNPANGDLWIVEKNDGDSGVYKLPAPTQNGSYTLQRKGTIKVGSAVPFSGLTTGGAIAPNRQNVVIRTYLGAYEYTADPKKFDRWFESRPRRITLRSESQGEAICYSTDGKKILTTSEGTPCPVSALTISGGVTRR
jgi:hypothetical protein